MILVRKKGECHSTTSDLISTTKDCYMSLFRFSSRASRRRWLARPSAAFFQMLMLTFRAAPRLRVAAPRLRACSVFFTKAKLQAPLLRRSARDLRHSDRSSARIRPLNRERLPPPENVRNGSSPGGFPLGHRAVPSRCRSPAVAHSCAARGASSAESPRRKATSRPRRCHPANEMYRVALRRRASENR